MPSIDMREPPSQARAVVLMGPAGSGKSTVGTALAHALNVLFIDADEEHSPASLDKMRRGVPLDESDRLPWLTRLHARILATLQAGQSVVLACSALKSVHREILSQGDRRVMFVYLEVPEAALAERLARRRGHFAGPELLQSQLAAFEPPDDAITVAGTAAPDDLVATIKEMLKKGGTTLAGPSGLRGSRVHDPIL